VCRAAKPPLPPLVVPTLSSILRPLAPPTRAAPACPKTPCSSCCHLLLKPSRHAPEQPPPAEAAAGLRHARPSVTSSAVSKHQSRFPASPRASPATPRPSSPARSPEFLQVAPPPRPKDHIARSGLLLRSFVQTKSISVII
jgi:hypothetical protein